MGCRDRILITALLLPIGPLLGCATEEPWAERVGMVSLGPVPTVTIPVVTLPPPYDLHNFNDHHNGAAGTTYDCCAP